MPDFHNSSKQIMRPSCSHAVLLVSVLLIIFSLQFPHGSGRKAMKTFDPEYAATVPLEVSSREMVQLDYADAGPNVNAKSGFPFINTPPPPPPLPPSPPPEEG